jgi:N-ethylmaleimide reductase
VITGTSVIHPGAYRVGAPLNPYDRRTFYAFDARGYTDYPKYEAHEAGEACLV